MVFTISLSAQEKQQQYLTVSNIDMHNVDPVFNLKTYTTFKLTWFNGLRLAHAILVLVCSASGLWLPLMWPSEDETLDTSFSGINGSSINDMQYARDYAKQCSLSPTIPMNMLNSYISMKDLNVWLCMPATVLPFAMNCFYQRDWFEFLKKPNLLFRWRISVFIGLVISIICSQLVNAFVCRSIDILYNIRFTSMIIVQIVGFIVCLVFAFRLGMKYASLKHAA